MIIAISGKKRSGKNTVANLISKEFYDICSVEQFALADPLKQEICKVFNVTIPEIETNKGMFRELLQAWGLFRRRFNGDKYWLELLLRKLTRSNARIMIVTDVRFQNEFNILKAAGALMVRVNRTFDDKDPHPSENGLEENGFDYTIDNDGDEQDLVKKTKELITYIHNDIQTRQLPNSK